MEGKTQNKLPFSDPFDTEFEENELDVEEKVEVARDTTAIQQLLTHVPDVLIKCDHKKQVPYVEQFTGVCLFADISGFTSLCEKYNNLSDSESTTCGTDQLSSTLNAYLGKIVEGILRNGGDVLKFAGDALFAIWKTEDSSANITPLVNSATMCSLAIQEECDNYMTEVGVLLRVKTAVAVGVVYITFLGVEDNKQFDMSGPAIDDANAAETWAEPGSVILSQLAWNNCEQGLFLHELVEDGHHYKVLGVKQQEVIASADLTNISIFVASMTGLLTAHSMRMTTPSMAKRALGPHLGDFFEKYFPYWKTPKIFRNVRKGRKEFIADKVNVSSGIAGLMNYDPDARLLMYSQLSDQEVDDLRAYVPKPVLYKIDHHQDLEWLSEMRQVSVLFINMALPKNVFESAQAVQKAYEVIYEMVRRLKGNLNKVFSFDKGCTFVVIFGLPGDKHDDDPARAVIAGYRILKTLHTILEITNESIGITTGRAFCGVVGHLDRHEYTVIGSKVNMAARLMMNYPNIVSCDEETYKASLSKLNKQDFNPLPSKPLKGIADPGVIREYTKDHDRILEEDDEVDYPILGREKEQELFRSILRDIKPEDSHLDDQGTFVLIAGEAGIGKTRMLEEFMDIAENEEFRMDFVEADMSHAQTPFYVVQNLITTLLELEGCSSVSEREKKIQAYVKDEDLKAELCLLNDLLGTHIPGHAKLIHMDDNTVSEHQHLLLFEIVHQVVIKEPCVFAVENAHFIDCQSWNFLEGLVRDSHAVLVMTMKPLNTVTLPDSAKRLVGDSKTLKITLGGLHADLMIDMACQFLDVTCIPRDLEKIIREKSHGVASWCEQLVKDMLCSNYIRVVSSKEIVIQDESELTLSPDTSNLHENIPLATSRPCTPSVPPQSTTKIFLNEPKEHASRPLSTVSRSSSSNKPLSAIRRKSMSFVKTLTLRRGSVSSEETEKEEGQRLQRLSNVSSTHVKSFDEDLDEDILIGSDATQDEEQTQGNAKLKNIHGEWSADYRDKKCTSAILTPIPRYFMPPEYFVYANSSAIVQGTDNMCIVSPGVDLTRIPVPESLREMVLARFDRMPPLEKVVLKCSSILGDSFPSDLVSAIVPRSAASQVNIALYHLLKERILECATLAHHHQHAHNHHGFIDTTHAHSQHHHHHHHHHVASSVSDMVPCGCYASEGIKVVNLTKFLTKNKLKKPCLYLKFSNNCVQETTYGLWLKKQREGLHQRTAIHLESQAHKCRACGGGAFLPDAMKTEQQDGVGPRRTTMSSGRSSIHFSSDSEKRRSSRLIREKVHEQGAFSNRVTDRIAASDSVKTAPRTVTIRDDVMMMDGSLMGEHSRIPRDQRNSSRHQGGIGPVLVSSAVVDNQDKDGVSYEHFDPRLFSFFNRQRGKSGENISSVPEEGSLVDTSGVIAGLTGVDMSKCQCAEVLASVFPQLVTHWKAAGNKLKTFRYLTESGAAALAACNNMQALSYLHEVQAMLQEKGQNFVANSEEKARVESLIGQAMLGMNRLDAALVHLYAALKELGVSQPVTAVQVSLNIYREFVRQRFRQMCPARFLQSVNDYDAGLVERARCFFHISHVYHHEGMHKESFMAALQELNTAERIGDNFHELLTAYTSVIECCGLMSWGKYAARIETMAIERCKQEARYVTPDDLITVSNFYAVVSTFRLSRGQVSRAVDAGFKSLSLANKLNDHLLKVNGIPSLAQSLLLMSKIDVCCDVLKELNYAAREKDDAHGRAMYYCNCLDLILETGHKLENLNDCLQFTAKATIDPCLIWDFIVRYYLNASLVLWYARCENWKKAEEIFPSVKAMEPATFDVVMAGRAFVKVVEYDLLLLKNDRSDKTLRTTCHKALADLSQTCKRFEVLKPRYFHLRAYYNMLCGNYAEAKSTLLKCIKISTRMGTTMETEWAILSKHEWFDNNQTKNAFNYSGHTKYPLPIPK